MFEPISAAASPQRSGLAGPASALAHGLALSGLLLAGWWNAAEPELPDRAVPIPDFIVRLGPGPGGSPPRRTGGGPTTPKPPARRADAFVPRIPDAPILTPPDAKDSPVDRPGDGADGDRVGPGRPGQGDCDDCDGPGGLKGLSDSGDRVFEPGGQVLAPLLVARMEPSYPEAMRRARQEGMAVVQAIIGRDGAIEQAEVVSATNALFEAEALKAVRQWRYRPGTLNGQPVRVLLSVVVTFRMR